MKLIFIIILRVKKQLPAPSTAVRADPVKHHAVGGQSKSVDTGLLFLKLLDLLIDELNVTAAFFTYNVVMVGNTVTGLVSRNTVTEINPLCDTSIGKEFNGSVYCSLAYGRVGLSDNVIQLFG